MKKISLLFMIACMFAISCNQNQSGKAENENDTTVVDSIAEMIAKYDSINNSGLMIHRALYSLGTLKSITFDVRTLETSKDTIHFIALTKDVGGQYYYNWETAIIYPQEMKYLFEAIQTIEDNCNREVSHEEGYIYVTRDDIRLSSMCEKGNDWGIYLSVDYRKDNASITLKKEDLKTLRSLLSQGLKKIEEISGKNQDKVIAKNDSIPA